jgi:hypothetical protein
MLQPVADEARHVLLHMRRLLAGSLVQRHGPGDDLRRRPLRFNDFDQRHQERRIPPMSAERALFADQVLHDCGNRNHRRIAGQNGVAAHAQFELGEKLLLQREILGHRFDDEVGVPHRLGEIDARLDALDRLLVIAEIAQVRRYARRHSVEI